MILCMSSPSSDSIDLPQRTFDPLSQGLGQNVFTVVPCWFVYYDYLGVRRGLTLIQTLPVLLSLIPFHYITNV